MKSLRIGDITLEKPIIQGGMGVGVSRGRLAGAVSACGGLGVISSAQIGYDEPEFATDQVLANEKAIRKHIALAKQISGDKPVGINIMVALKHYEDHVRTAVDAGVDVIISGAGLPMRLPEYVGDSGCKIAPIVSSVKAAQIILRQWKKKYCRTADFIVIEGPKAGGHLGFKKEDIATITAEKYEQEIKNIIQVVREYEQEFACEIPVIVAGGIFDHKDIEHALEIGADGVQIASRFVATEECDASDAYKQAYINAKAEDITIVMSPVGMPGRALNNVFVQRVSRQREEIKKCYNCLAKCNPVEVPYCITKALISAVQGDLDHGLIFVGANVDRIDRMTSVQELMDDLAAGYRRIIADVYAAGCRNLQFDDCSWGMLVDPRACMIFDTDAKGLEEIKEQMLTVNNMAIGGKPDDLVINTHVCRGNFHSTYASSGAYDSVAKTLLARENVNAYYLEFDDARSGGFEPLASVSGEKKVVLGLVTTKRPELESKDAVIARIHEAAKYLPLDRLCLSLQCGFASCEIGNKLTEAQQWAKLALVKEIAEEVWG